MSTPVQLPSDPQSAGSARPIVLAIENEEADRPLWVGEWIEECGIEVQVVRGWDGDEVPTAVPDGVSGVLALGGAMGAMDDHLAPWLVRERALLADAVESAVPVLGLCLGAQLLAAANGGRVELGPVAEVGLTYVMRTDASREDQVISAIDAPSDRIPAAQWHQDHITALPDDAVLLLTNDACVVQGFRLGSAAYGLQLHPEVDPETFDSWAVADDEALARSGRDPREAAAEVRQARADLIRAWRPMTRAWCDRVWARASERTR